MPQSTYSLEFDGVNGRVAISSQTHLAGDFTFFCWIKPDSVSGYRCVVGSPSARFSLYLPSSTSVYYRNADASEGGASCSETWTTGDWQHFCWRRAGSTNTVFRNGIASATWSSGATYGTPVQIDLGYDSAGGGAHFDGRIDDSGLLTTGLSDAQIAGLAAGTTDPSTLSPGGLWRLEEGSGTSTADTGSGGNAGTLSGGVSWSSDVPDELAGGGGTVDATGSSSITFGVSGVGSALVSASGTAGLTFTPSGVGASSAAGAGTAGLTFLPSGVGSSAVSAAGSAGIAFTPTAAGSSFASSTGTATLTFTASGISDVDGSTGSAGISFSASAAGSAVASAAGTAGLVFTTTGTGSSVASGSGVAGIVFTPSASGSAIVSAVGSTGIVFSVTAVSPTDAAFLPEEVYRAGPETVYRLFYRDGSAWGRTFYAEANGVSFETRYITNAESKTFGFDYSTFGALLSGAELTGTPVVTVDPSGPTVTGAAVVAEAFFDSDRKRIKAGKGVSARVTGATAGEEYTITCLAVTDGGDTLEVSGRLVCLASGDDVDD